MDPAVELRHQVGQLNDTRLSLNDLVIKTAALGLRRSWKRPISLAF